MSQFWVDARAVSGLKVSGRNIIVSDGVHSARNVFRKDQNQNIKLGKNPENDRSNVAFYKKSQKLVEKKSKIKTELKLDPETKTKAEIKSAREENEDRTETEKETKMQSTSSGHSSRPTAFISTPTWATVASATANLDHTLNKRTYVKVSPLFE